MTEPEPICGWCRKPMPCRASETMGNWGDWRCSCGAATCQDCGSPINMITMQCIAYEEQQDEEGQEAAGA